MLSIFIVSRRPSNFLPAFGPLVFCKVITVVLLPMICGWFSLVMVIVHYDWFRVQEGINVKLGVCPIGSSFNRILLPTDLLAFTGAFGL